MAKNNSNTVDSILADLTAGKIAPVYFLQGEEPFFIDQIADYIEKNLLPESEKGFNQTIIYGKDTDINSVLIAAKRFPMMAQRQVVIVKEAQEVKDLEKSIKNKVGGKEIEFTPLEEYIKNPVPTTVLVFCFKYKTLDGRKGLAKLLDEKAILYTSKGLYDNELPLWIQKTVKAKGHSISDKGTQLLAEFVGNNLSRLSNEIDKILINFKEKTLIEETHVLKFVGVSKEYNVFELQNALSKKDVLKCNKIVQYFAENPKENPLPLVLGNLYAYFSKILIVRTAKTTNEFDVSKLIGLPPFIAKEYVTAARNYDDNKVMHVFSYLREADMRSKGFENNSLDDKAILQELVFKILH